MPLQPEYNVIVPGVLWVGSHPERSGPLPQILAALHGAGVRGIITLTETPLDPEDLAAAGIEGLHLPVMNYSAPSLEQLAQGSAFIERSAARGGPTLVHCFAGIGRAGTMAAGFLVSRGASVDDAIAEVRRLRHSSCVESAAQREALEAFAQRPR